MKRTSVKRKKVVAKKNVIAKKKNISKRCRIRVASFIMAALIMFWSNTSVVRAAEPFPFERYEKDGYGVSEAHITYPDCTGEEMMRNGYLQVAETLPALIPRPRSSLC